MVDRDDRGTMPLLLMVMLAGLLIAGLLVPIVITTNRSTRFTTSRVHAFDAAQGGIDLILEKIRATSTGGVGNSAGLPCNPATGSYIGAIDSTGSGAYSVNVAYYVTDPVAYSATHSGTLPIAMVCSQGYGTYDALSGSRTPRYALITSTGTDGTAGNGITQGRTVQTTYRFKTNDTNIPGGVFRIYPSSTATSAYCMDAGSAQPASGATISMQVCSSSTPPISQQVFAYRTDLTIELLSSEGSTYATGLCLTAASASAGANILLKPCPAYSTPLTQDSTGSYIRTAPTYLQMWNSDDSAHLRGSNSDLSDTSGVCLNVAAQSAGQLLTQQNCAGGVTDPNQTWVPAPSAGAGQAGAANSQLDNYQQFGRCLDVTNQDVTASGNGGGNFLILYSCKQNPNAAKIGSNQIWKANPTLTSAPIVVQWVTSKDTTYCLYSSLIVGSYATTQKCTLPAANTKWTTYQTLDANGKPLSYSDLYTIKDSAGNCLGLSANSDVYNGAYYKAIIAVCDGSASQKWNAAATLSKSQLQNTIEK